MAAFDKILDSLRDDRNSIDKLLELLGNLSIIPQVLNEVQLLRKEVQGLKMDLQKILDLVTQQKTVADSAVALLQELKKELDAALASGDTTKLQAIADAIGANTQELSDAITANTPAAPPAGGGGV